MNERLKPFIKPIITPEMKLVIKPLPMFRVDIDDLIDQMQTTNDFPLDDYEDLGMYIERAYD